jgi:hypothetical protein
LIVGTDYSGVVAARKHGSIAIAMNRRATVA